MGASWLFPFCNKQCGQVLQRIVSFLPDLYFTGPLPSCVGQRSAPGGGRGRRSRGSWADELSRSGAGVTGLFWLRRKPRSRQRKWLLCLCVLLYIGAPRPPHTSKAGEPRDARVTPALGCRTEGGGRGGEASGIMWSPTPAKKKKNKPRRTQSSQPILLQHHGIWL